MQGEPSRRYLRECTGEGGGGGGVLCCLTRPRANISERQEETHVLPYSLKYLWAIALPLLNKANKAVFGHWCHSPEKKRIHPESIVLSGNEINESY